ncbi:MAG: phosphate ABC transporter permease subunit PstC [Actinobacteria bacterium]|jgi:phosphate transport system permease protein|nr:phosphate ABC transporter permease subunit PstC [Actinomycetota bacterium]
MSTTVEPPGSAAPDAPAAIKGAAVRRGDRVFLGLSRGAGVLILVIMAAIAAFLVWKAVPSLQANTANFFTTSEWTPDADPAYFGIAALAFGTLMTAVIAMVLAVPVGIGIALFIAHYANRRLGSALGFITDLLAAVPSIIFGMWGLEFLMPQMQGFLQWLTTYFGWIPLFQNDLGIWTRSIMIAGTVLAIMVLPTVSAISREVFVQVPREHIEAALALGATRWEMVRMAIFPFAKPGMISASMLGLGRALGETIAVALILSANYVINWQITEPGGNTFAANIALRWNEAGPIGLSALVASGLVLFVITLAVNMAARLIIARRAEFSGANG